MSGPIRSRSEQSVTDLIEQKCLQPLRGPTIDRYPAWRFKLATIHDLKRKIRKRIVDKSTDSETITFHHALRIVQRIGYDMGKFVKGLLDAEISAVECDEDGGVLAALRFSKRQISELADRIVENINADCVYVKEAATILKLNTGAVISLCDSKSHRCTTGARLREEGFADIATLHSTLLGKSRTGLGSCRQH